jgi:hypothetical protein
MADVRHAKETEESVKAQLEELQQAFQSDVDQLSDAYDAQAEEFKETLVRPATTDIDVRFVALGWIPEVRDAR